MQNPMIRLLAELVFDFRSAVRVLLKDRSFSLTAIATLALATGLNTAAYIVMDAMLYRGFPVVETDDRLLYMQQRDSLGITGLSYPEFEAWSASARSFNGMAFLDSSSVTFGDAAGQRRMDLRIREISANTFGLLGVRPFLGRDFVTADQEAGSQRVLILSHRFWLSRFGGRPDIIGQTVSVNDDQVTIVGVMPENFSFPEQESLWMPVVRTSERQQWIRTGWAVGRLALQASSAQAVAELETISRGLAAEYPETNRDVVPRVAAHTEFFVGPDARDIYLAVWAGGWFVLLVACANLANLALARMLGRWQEFKTRIALGATRRRLIQYALSEWLTLGLLGGALGWLLAFSGVGAWADLTDSQYRVLDYSVGYETASYSVIVSIIAAILIAIVPVVQLIFPGAHASLTSSARGTTDGRQLKSVSRVLVTGQVALAIVLIGGAGVVTQSFWHVVAADVGINAPENIVHGYVDLPNSDYATADQQAAFFETLKGRVSSLPGVESVAISNTRPVNNMFQRRVEVETPGGETIGPESLTVLTASRGYFATIGAQIFAGREFDNRDGADTPLVAVVNASFAARFAPGQDLVGQRLRYYNGDEPGEWRTIVGVSSNIMQSEPTRQRFLPLVYLPFGQSPWPDAWFFARTQTVTPELANNIRSEVESLEPDLLLEEFSTLESSFRFIEGRMDLAHVNMGRLAAVAPIFAGIALLLAAVGLYAVLSRSVRRRRREIGIRMAMGATRTSIRTLVLRAELAPILVGIVVGLAASFGVNRILESQLVGVAPTDLPTFISAPILLILVVLLSCQLPARDAARVDPAVTLRNE